jgi:hypothetical protein
MLRNRLLIAMGVFFLAASGAWADDVGYVDCSKNADATQVFGKPRKTPDVVASLPCGERFTILVYGFYFSRIQTKDGQIGYIFSSLIMQDRGVTSLQQVASAQPAGQKAGQQSASLQVAAEKTKIPRPAPFDAQPAATQVQPAALQAAQPAEVVIGSAQTSAAEVIVSAAPATDAKPGSTIGAAAAATQPTADQSSAQLTSAQAAVTTAPVFTTPPTAPTTPNADAAEAAPAATRPAANAEADAQPAAAQPAAQPEPPAAAPAPAQPAPIQPAPSIRPVDTRDRWEKPQPSGRQAPLLEVFGGFSFARLGSGGPGSNLVGALGSFGWNANSWLQVSADTSYNLETNGNTKTVLYGNHYGPRFYYRRRNRWNLTPFAEALIGGSAEKTTISGTGGSVTSTGSQISYKFGGGLDMRPSRRWEIRLFDVDYYRTAFGTNTQQSNYWISAGVVLRLFGGGNE